KKHDAQKALSELKAAFVSDPSDSRILFELDQLYRRLNHNPIKRLDLLEEHLYLVKKRDDLYLELVTIYNLLGRYEKAFEMLMNRKFHPWEGGEGKVSAQYVLCLTELAKNAIADGGYKKALKLLEQTKVYPENLGEGKLTGKQENDINYWMGITLEKMGINETAIRCWEIASKGMNEPEAAVFYYDP